MLHGRSLDSSVGSVRVPIGCLVGIVPRRSPWQARMQLQWRMLNKLTFAWATVGLQRSV